MSAGHPDLATRPQSWPQSTIDMLESAYSGSAAVERVCSTDGRRHSTLGSGRHSPGHSPLCSPHRSSSEGALSDRSSFAARVGDSGGSRGAALVPQDCKPPALSTPTKVVRTASSAAFSATPATEPRGSTGGRLEAVAKIEAAACRLESSIEAAHKVAAALEAAVCSWKSANIEAEERMAKAAEKLEALLHQVLMTAAAVHVGSTAAAVTAGTDASGGASLTSVARAVPVGSHALDATAAGRAAAGGPAAATAGCDPGGGPAPQMQQLLLQGDSGVGLLMNLPINIVTYNIHSLKEAASKTAAGAAMRAADAAKRAAEAAVVAAQVAQEAKKSLAKAAAAESRAASAKKIAQEAADLPVAAKTEAKRASGKANVAEAARKNAAKHAEDAAKQAEVAKLKAADAKSAAKAAKAAARAAPPREAASAAATAMSAHKATEAAVAAARKSAGEAATAEARASAAADKAMEAADQAREKLEKAVEAGMVTRPPPPSPQKPTEPELEPELKPRPCTEPELEPEQQPEPEAAAAAHVLADGDEEVLGDTDLTLLEAVLAVVMDIAGWALAHVPHDVQSPGRLDVVCLQEMQVDKEVQHLRDEVLQRMRERGYDCSMEGEHVILWNRSTLERVADAKSGGTHGGSGGGGRGGGDRMEPDTRPDYVWCRKTDKGQEYLDNGAAWGDMESYRIACRKMALYQEHQRGKDHKLPADVDTFFRYPPITVVLRRRFETTGSNTTYVITTAHTPGSGTNGTDGVQHLDQLQREVEWLMTRDTYGRVMRHMEQRKRWTEHVLDGKDVVHVVAGDFNVQHYSKTALRANTGGCAIRRARLGLPLPLSTGTSALDAWQAYQGSKEQYSEPSTASNYPDVVYVLKKSMEGSDGKPALYNIGVLVLPLARTGPRLFSGSDHKPLLVSFREEGQRAMPVRSQAAAVRSILRERVQAAVDELLPEVQAKVDLLVQALPAQAVLAQLHEAHPMQNVWNRGGLR